MVLSFILQISIYNYVTTNSGCILQSLFQSLLSKTLDQDGKFTTVQVLHRVSCRAFNSYIALELFYTQLRKLYVFLFLFFAITNIGLGRKCLTVTNPSAYFAKILKTRLEICRWPVLNFINEKRYIRTYIHIHIQMYINKHTHIFICEKGIPFLNCHLFKCLSQTTGRP